MIVAKMIHNGSNTMICFFEDVHEILLIMKIPITVHKYTQQYTTVVTNPPTPINIEKSNDRWIYDIIITRDTIVIFPVLLMISVFQ